MIKIYYSETANGFIIEDKKGFWWTSDYINGWVRLFKKRNHKKRGYILIGEL